MAIRFLNDQPIDFRGHLPSYSLCKANNCDSYCSIYNANDTIKFQFATTESGNAELLCNSSLINNNTELITNGGFDSGSTGWVLSNYVYDSVNHLLKSTATSGYAKQSVSAVNGKYYDVLFTVTLPVNGYMEWYIGSQQQLTITSSGTYSVRALAGTGGFIQFNTNAINTTLDNISLKDSLIGNTNTYCFQVYSTNEWRYDQNAHSIYKIGSTAVSISTLISPPHINGFIKFSFDILNTNNGSLQLILNGANYSNEVKMTITADGRYDCYFNYYGLNTGNTIELKFLPTSTWNGSILNLTCRDYSFTSAITLVGDNNVNVNLSPYITQHDEFVTVTLPLEPLALADGTYNICVDEVVSGDFTDKDMIGNWDMNSSDWSGTGITVSIGNFLQLETTTAQQYIFNTTSWDAGMYASNTMGFDYDILTRDWNTTSTVATLYLIDINTNQIVSTLVPSLEAGRRYTGSIVVNVNASAWDPGLRIDFIDPPAYHDINQFEFIRLVQTGYSAITYCSNCIDIKSSHRCTLWIAGSCDTEAFGMDFTNNFEIAGRVRAMFLNPKYKGSQQKYIDNAGKTIVTSNSSGKIYTFLIDYAPEKTHDWLRLALSCDVVKIGSSPSTTTEWVNVDADYTPEWIDNIGNFPLAQCRVELQARIDEKYNNNPG